MSRLLSLPSHQKTRFLPPATVSRISIIFPAPTEPTVAESPPSPDIRKSLSVLFSTWAHYPPLFSLRPGVFLYKPALDQILLYLNFHDVLCIYYNIYHKTPVID